MSTILDIVVVKSTVVCSPQAKQQKSTIVTLVSRLQSRGMYSLERAVVCRDCHLSAVELQFSSAITVEDEDFLMVQLVTYHSSS